MLELPAACSKQDRSTSVSSRDRGMGIACARGLRHLPSLDLCVGGPRQPQGDRRVPRRRRLPGLLHQPGQWQDMRWGMQLRGQGRQQQPARSDRSSGQAQRSEHASAIDDALLQFLNRPQPASPSWAFNINTQLFRLGFGSLAAAQCCSTVLHQCWTAPCCLPDMPRCPAYRS